MVAAAATQPTAIAIVMAEVPAHRRVRAMGLWSLVGAGSPVIGLVAGDRSSTSSGGG